MDGAGLADSSASQAPPPESDDDIVERSPDERYSRFRQELGVGSYKAVYKGYDEEEGIEVEPADVVELAIQKILAHFVCPGAKVGSLDKVRVRVALFGWQPE